MKEGRSNFHILGKTSAGGPSPWVEIWLIGSLAAIIYAGTINYGFVFDDLPNIFGRPQIVEFHGLRGVCFLLMEKWRSITDLSLALTYRLFGNDAHFFHAGNIFVHVINSILVWAIARKLTMLWPLKTSNNTLFRLGAAALFAAHPLHSEAVAYVWGRSSSLCAAFYFACILFILKGILCGEDRKTYLWYCLATAAGVLAIRAKEEAVTLPFILAAIFVLSNKRRAALFLILITMVGTIAAAVIWWPELSQEYSRVAANPMLTATGMESPLAPKTYFLTSLNASVFYYLFRFLLPLHLNADPQVPIVTSPFDLTFISALLILLALTAFAIYLTRRNPMISFGILALLISPLCSYALIPVADVVAEHRIYIAGLGFCILAAYCFVRMIRIGAIVLFLLVIAYACGTLARNSVWSGDLALWEDAAKKSPKLPRPHLNLGLAYQSLGRDEQAIGEYNLVLELNPNLAPARMNIGSIYLSQGDLNGAEREFHLAVKSAPFYFPPHLGLATVDLQRGRLDSAASHVANAGLAARGLIAQLNYYDAPIERSRFEKTMLDFRASLPLSAKSVDEEVSRVLSEMR